MTTNTSISPEAASRGDIVNGSINVEGDTVGQSVNRRLSPFEQRYRAFRDSIDTHIKSALPDWDEITIGSFKRRHRDFPVHQPQIQLTGSSAD